MSCTPYRRDEVKTRVHIAVEDGSSISLNSDNTGTTLGWITEWDFEAGDKDFAYLDNNISMVIMVFQDVEGLESTLILFF